MFFKKFNIIRINQQKRVDKMTLVSNTEEKFETEWIIKAISHEIRRNIINLLEVNSHLTYTELLKELNLTTGKLNFHLRQLVGLVEKHDDGFYRLTPAGTSILKSLLEIKTIGDEDSMSETHRFYKGFSIRQFNPAEETIKKFYVIILLITSLILIPTLITFIILIAQNGFNFSVELIITIVLMPAVIFSLGVAILLTRKYIQSISYNVYDTEISINKGFITKSKVVIPFRTITNLFIRRGFFDRIYGLSSLAIETAGQGGNQKPEGKIIGIYYPNELLEEILGLLRMLDPPSYLKQNFKIEKKPLEVRYLLSEINEQLSQVRDKLLKTDEKEK